MPYNRGGPRAEQFIPPPEKFLPPPPDEVASHVLDTIGDAGNTGFGAAKAPMEFFQRFFNRLGSLVR